MLSVFFTVILFIFILSILVMVHEWGHFVFARKMGMKVFEFGWGFPPRAFGAYKDPVTKKWVWVWGRGKNTLKETVGGDERHAEFPATLYSVNWLPIGGFVKIKGENGEEAADPDSFGHHKPWKKLVVLVAGVAMNFVLAAFLFSIGLMIGLPVGGQLEDSRAIIVEPSAVMVLKVENDSPADKAGIHLGDKILKINDIPMATSDQTVAFVRDHSAETMTVLIERQGARITEVVKPAPLETGDTPRLGVMLGDAGIVRYPWYIALYKGFVVAAMSLLSLFISFFILLKHLVLGEGMVLSPSGPVGIAVLIGESARLGFNYLLNMTAMISLSLAAINILPIPALDGGRAFFIIIEKLTGRKVPIRYEQVAHTIGFVLLMSLIVVVTWRDIKGLL